MLLLILKSSTCLAVFMVFYKLFLEKESIHHFKRFYLLGALLVSIGIPFITFTQYIEVVPTQGFIPFQPLDFSNTDVLTPEVTTTWQDYIPTILWSMYFIGVLLFSFRFALNLRALFYRIRTNPKHQYREFTNVLLQDLIHPHTFFKYIFLNKTKYEHNLIPNEVILHEQTHAKQKHAIDILCIEVLQIIFWFNPLLYFIKKDIKLNHEFLADQAVLQKGIDSAQYKQILLAFSSDATEPQLANAINYSLIKKRFTVMKTKTSKQAFWLRSVLLLPILAILIYSFSEKEIVEKEVALLEPSTIQQVKTDKGATEAMMKEYKAFIKSTEASNMIRQGKLQRAIAIYNLMTDSQRAMVKKYPKAPPVNLARVKPKTPSATEFNSWKNKEKFAIWVDGKNVSNEILNNYSTSDIIYYTVSKVYKNAQTKKHPQPFQNHLYTKEGFEENYLKRNVKKYNALKTEYQNAQKTLKQDDSELRILKVRLDRAYNILSKEEIEKYDVGKVEFSQSGFQQNNNTKALKKALKNSVTTVTNMLQQKATQEEIKEYNKIVKKLNSQPENKRIFKQKDVVRIEYIYGLMTKEQKENAEQFPKLVPPPPPAMDTISTYSNLAKRAKFIPSNRKNNLQHLKVLFKKMSSSQKEKVESPNNISKYIAQLDKLTTEQVKKVNDVYNKIKARAQSKGRKFYSAAEYKELEGLYASMLSSTK